MSQEKRTFLSRAVVTSGVLLTAVSLNVNATSYYGIGNSTYGSDGYSSYSIGNSTYGNDGSSAYGIGNSAYGSDGTSCYSIGNTIYCS